MPITLGTNIPSYITRTSLNSVTDKLSLTLEKLSSGNRIIKAGDDPAGLVISKNMQDILSRSKQAMSNIQTSESCLNIAEDAMGTISDHLQRINDLLEGMASDTYDIDSRVASIQEIIERLSEIDRIAESVNYNGKKLIDGSVDKMVVQMGVDSNSASTLDISKALLDCHVSALGPSARVDGLKGVQLPVSLNPEEADFDPNSKNCREYLGIIQDAIYSLASSKGFLGAYENRMESSYDNLQILVESLEDSKSVYTDVDVAEEATNFASRQILQQLNISLLQSANVMPQTALQLLIGG